VVGRLQDDDAQVRVRAAQLCGELQLADGKDALLSMLHGDAVPAVRQAAAWALGRLGGAGAELRAARGAERDDAVLDALDVALRMSP
jgi:HEAT repeat protein